MAAAFANNPMTQEGKAVVHMGDMCLVHVQRQLQPLFQDLSALLADGLCLGLGVGQGSVRKESTDPKRVTIDQSDLVTVTKNGREIKGYPPKEVKSRYYNLIAI